MIADLLPPTVVAVERRTDDPDEPVFAGEEHLVVRAVPERRREFVTARSCARAALARLGWPSRPIGSGSRREPLWPSGVAGSITHCAGYRAAAVVRTSDVASIGIDAEPHQPLPAEVLGLTTLDTERDMLMALSRHDPSTHWDRLLFSAKESVYKAWYPLTGRWLGFQHAQLRIDPGGSFTARVLVDATRTDGGPPLINLHGRHLVADGLILTAAVVGHGRG